MANNTKWENPKCKGCGKEIEFVQLRNYKGEIKSHPVEIDKNYIIIATGEKTEKGQYIYESKRVLKSHFVDCPAAAEFRSKNQSDKNPQGTPETGTADDKPPF